MRIMRKVLVWIIALGVILWIVLSYLPRDSFALPEIGFPGAWRAHFGLAALALFALFIVLQLALLWRVRLLRKIAHPGIRYGAELFWTALPLAMTLALAAAAYATFIR